MESLKEIREDIIRLKRDHPDLDFVILATELTYWAPDFEKLSPNTTNWATLP
jgi:hypothetical protein